MFRISNTSSRGSNFDAATVAAVWSKGREVPGSDPTVFRKDACGAWMRRSDYGETTPYGWEIDHIKPVAQGGSDDLSNLQPLNWKNNRHKGDSWPNWNCEVSD